MIPYLKTCQKDFLNFQNFFNKFSFWKSDLELYCNDLKKQFYTVDSILIFGNGTHFKNVIKHRIWFEVIWGQLEVILRKLILTHFRVFVRHKDVFFNPFLSKLTLNMIMSLVKRYRNHLKRNRKKNYFSYDLTLWFHSFDPDFDAKNIQIWGNRYRLFCSSWPVDLESAIKNRFIRVSQLDGGTLKSSCSIFVYGEFVKKYFNFRVIREE